MHMTNRYNDMVFDDTDQCFGLHTEYSFRCPVCSRRSECYQEMMRMERFK